MSNTPYLPFDDIKAAYTVEELMDMTGLQWRKDGQSFRTECPVHGGGKRSLVVTSNKLDDKGSRGCFYCFGDKTGGDRVSLLAHVRQSKPYAVFKELAEKRPATKPEAQPPVTAPEEKEHEGGDGRGFRPLPYLVADHTAVTALGFSPEIALAAGIGYAPRGYHRDGVAVPIRTDSGQLLGYISISATGVKLPPKWKL